MARLVAFLVVFAVGCGGGATPSPAETTTGAEEPDEDEELTLSDWDLPYRPHGVEWNEPPFADAVRIAEESLAEARPPLEAGTTPAEMHVWVDGVLHEWLLERARAIRDVRTELEEAASGEEAQVVAAAGILAVMYADLAWQIVEIVLPSEVREDELGALAMRNALLQLASPLFEQALSAFGACSANAVGSADPTVERWARFCDEEGERVLDAPHPIDASAGARASSHDEPRDDDE